MAFVTNSNRPQPLWLPPPTACLTASEAPSNACLPAPPPSLLIHAWVVVAVPMVGVAWRGALRDRAAPCRPLSRTYSLVTSADGCVDTTYDFKYVEYRKAPAPVTGCPAGAAVDRALCLGPAMYLQCKAECDARGYAGACAADYAASGIAALPAFCQYATGSRCAARFCASDHRWECTAECDALGIYRMPPPRCWCIYLCICPASTGTFAVECAPCGVPEY